MRGQSIHCTKVCFVAFGNITTAENNASTLGQWAVYFFDCLWENITVRLTTCLDGVYSTKQVILILFNKSKAKNTNRRWVSKFLSLPIDPWHDVSSSTGRKFCPFRSPCSVSQSRRRGQQMTEINRTDWVLGEICLLWAVMAVWLVLEKSSPFCKMLTVSAVFLGVI